MARRINAPSPADLITQAIIDRLEAGVRPWIKPWRPGVPSGRPLRANGLPYRGINTFWLWLAATTYGYRSQIGREHVLTPVTNAHIVCRILLEKKKTTQTHN